MFCFNWVQRVLTVDRNLWWPWCSDFLALYLLKWRRCGAACPDCCTTRVKTTVKPKEHNCLLLLEVWVCGTASSSVSFQFLLMSPGKKKDHTQSKPQNIQTPLLTLSSSLLNSSSLEHGESLNKLFNRPPVSWEKCIFNIQLNNSFGLLPKKTNNLLQ